MKVNLMVHVKPAMALLALIFFFGCGIEVQSPERLEERVKETEEKPRDKIPTFTYRPGGGLTITGGKE